MICPECKKEDKKSLVYQGMMTCTAMGFEQFYDEEGKHHSHNPNITTVSYSCTNGHNWSKKSSGSCWCGWGNK